MPDGTYATLGLLLDSARAEALEEWRKAHAAHVARQDLFSCLTSVTTQVIEWNLGRANITITIASRRRHETEVYFFLVQRQGGYWFFRDRKE